MSVATTGAMAGARLIYYSASQLEKFKRCNLRWWWEYVARQKPPESISQGQGRAIHKELELFVKEGTPPPGARASEALRHVKALGPREQLQAEYEFTRETHLPGRVFTGKIDLLCASKHKLRDYKSTSDINKFEKTDYQLQEDLQLNSYAQEAFTHLWPDAKTVEVGHIYVQTKSGIRSRETPVTIKREDARARWSEYLRIVDEIEEVRLLIKPEDVPHNETACNDYGGCAHRARCAALLFSDAEIAAANVFNLQTEDRWWEDDEVINPPDTTRRPPGAPPATPLTVDAESMPKALRKEQVLMNPAEKLAALARGQPARVEGPAPGKTESLAAKLAAAQGPPPPISESEEEIIGEVEEGAEETQEWPVPAEPSNDPSPPPPGHVWVFSPGTKTIIGCVPAASAPPPAATMPVPATRAKIDAAPPPVETAPRPRGRPKGSTNKPPASQAPAPAAPPPQAAPPPPVAPAPVQEAEPVAAGGNAIDFLFLDCFPVHGFPAGAMRFGTWIAAALERVKAKSGADWRFHDFRKGAGLLVEAIAALAAPPALIVDTATPEAREVLNHLIGRATVIIQGGGR